MLCFMLPWAILLKCHCDAHLHGNPSASDISTSYEERKGENEQLKTLRNPVERSIRRCNLCNLGNYACQDEHNVLHNAHCRSLHWSWYWCSSPGPDGRVYHRTALLPRLHPHSTEENEIKREQTRLLKLQYEMWWLLVFGRESVGGAGVNQCG